MSGTDSERIIMNIAPGTRYREFDLSLFNADGGDLLVGAVGTAHKGPVNVRTPVSSPAEYVNIFGNPTTQLGYLAQIYLAENGWLEVCRVVDGNAAKSIATALVSAAPVFTGEAVTYGTYGDDYSFKVFASTEGVVNKINIAVYLSGTILKTYEDIASFTELAALEGDLAFAEASGSPAWPTDWTGEYRTYTLSGGNSGLSSPDMSPFYRGTPAVLPSTPATGLHVFDEVKDTELNFITCCGMFHPDVVTDGLSLAETQRKDCVFFPDAPDGLSADEADAWSLGTFSGGPSVALNTSYGFFVYPWHDYADPYSGTDVRVAPSTMALAAIANSWAVANPYIDPAGLQRGRIKKSKGLAFNPSDREIAKTYSRAGHNVNWFVSIKGKGIYLWTQKTLQRKPSGRDRLSTRVSLNLAQSRLAARGLYFAHEPINETTMKNVAKAAQEILGEITADGGFRAFKVLCDKTINTDEVIARSEMYCKCMVKDQKYLEWLTFDWILVTQDTPL